MLDNDTIAILGASGQVGSEFVSLLQDDTNLILPSSNQLNLAEVEQIYSWLDRKQPTVIINAAAFTNVDGAENKRQEALALNAQLPSALASWCGFNHARLLHFSSDYVFSGDSPNDAPMFDFFSNSVGVANVLDFEESLLVPPRYVTESIGGTGFSELATILIDAKKGQP